MTSVTQGERATQPSPVAVPVVTRADRRAFVDLPYTLYANEPHWIPPLRRDEHRRLSERHNPFLAHARLRLWLVRRAGAVVGRVAAIDDDLHNQTHREQVTWFGFFEAADTDIATTLFGAVEEHARSRQSTVVRGPVNPSLNDNGGLLVEGFDDDPYILMPYNVRAYSSYVESAGYVKAKDLFAWDLTRDVPIGARVERVSERIAARRGAVVRPADLSSRGFARDVDHLKTIYRAAWQDNWGFVPPSDAEIDQMARALKPVIDPELVLFVEVRGLTVGCVVALPDLNQVLKRMRGRVLPFGFWHFLRRRTIVDRVRVMLLGVLPEYQRLGLYPLLMAELHRRGVSRGYRAAELSWTLEDNHLVNAGIEAAGGRRSKTYRIYEKRLR
jgi:GNAT superfamily N-acetyltransferase